MRHAPVFTLLGCVALAGGLWLLVPNRAANGTAIDLEQRPSSPTLPDAAPLPWLTQEDREPIEPPALPETSGRSLDDLTLVELATLLDARDTQGCERFIMDWFADAPRGVDRMLEVLSGLSAPGDAQACGLLLQSAMALMGPYGDRFLPWDRSSLISATVVLLDSNALASGVAFRGLAAYGPDATGQDMGMLIGLQSGADDPRFHDQGTQVQQVMLIQSWASDLAPAALEQVKALAIERGSWEIAYRKLALRVALTRDGGEAAQFYAQLLDQVANEKGTDSYAYSGSVESFRKAAVYAHLNDTPEDKGRYINELQAYPELAAAVVMALGEEEADAVLAAGSSDSITGFQGDLLQAIGSGEKSFEAGLRVLAAQEFDLMDLPSQAKLIRRALDRGDWTAVQSRLVAPPASDDKATEDYWSLMGLVSQSTSDQAAIESVVLPWIIATEGRPSPKRARLLTELRSRFPSLDWIE